MLLSTALLAAPGCTAQTVGTSTSGPPGTTIIYFFAPVPTDGSYEVFLAGGVFQNGGVMTAQRMPAYDNTSRPDGLSPLWVAYGINPTLVNGEAYTAEFGSRTGAGMYTYYGDATWTQDNQTEILIR